MTAYELCMWNLENFSRKFTKLEDVDIFSCLPFKINTFFNRHTISVNVCSPKHTMVLAADNNILGLVTTKIDEFVT